MAIPDFQSVMLPFLEFIQDGQTRTMREVTDALSDRFQLSDAERLTLLPSGQQPIIANRIAWAKTHLKNAGLVDNPSRGKVCITDLGRSVLAQRPQQINMKFLRQYPAYLQFVGNGSRGAATGATEDESVTNEARTPLELLDQSFNTLRQTTKDDLLARLKRSSPAFFERAVVKLLLAMGYGGVGGDGQITGQPGGGGIDGVIREDKLGLDVVCIQAKRWENNPVGRPKVQEFVGSMDFVRARKGVIITTSAFTRDALNFVERIEGKKVVLIDGDCLAELMMDHDVGVTVKEVYKLKELSNDFFDEDEE
jgi:restriction system protein